MVFLISSSFCSMTSGCLRCIRGSIHSKTAGMPPVVRVFVDSSCVRYAQQQPHENLLTVCWVALQQVWSILQHFVQFLASEPLQPQLKGGLQFGFTVPLQVHLALLQNPVTGCSRQSCLGKLCLDIVESFASFQLWPCCGRIA